MTKSSQKQKINWLLILQGWAMLWVVIGHAGPENDLNLYPEYAKFIYDTAYSFHMPLFIFISGFLFYLTRVSSEKWNYLTMMLDKLKRFGIPFLAFTVVGIFVKHVFGSSMQRPTELSFGELVNAILYPNNGPMREFWFLATIIWYFAFFPFWRVLIKSQSRIAASACLPVMLHYWHPATQLFAIDAACTYLVYFYFGLCAAFFYKRSDTHMADIRNKTLSVVMAVSLVLYIVARYFNLSFGEALTGILFSVAVAILMDRKIPSLFFTFRNYTYQIFLMGIFFQVFVKLVRITFDLPFLPMYVVSVALGLYIPVLISKLVAKTHFKPLMLCIGLSN